MVSIEDFSFLGASSCILNFLFRKATECWNNVGLLLSLLALVQIWGFSPSSRSLSCARSRPLKNYFPHPMPRRCKLMRKTFQRVSAFLRCFVQTHVITCYTDVFLSMITLPLNCEGKATPRRRCRHAKTVRVIEP